MAGKATVSRWSSSVTVTLMDRIMSLGPTEYLSRDRDFLAVVQRFPACFFPTSVTRSMVAPAPPRGLGTGTQTVNQSSVHEPKA